MAEPPPILLIDEDCGLCRAAARRVCADAPGVEICAIAGADPALLEGLSERQALGSMHLVLGPGERASGGAALPALLRLTGRSRLARLAERLPGPRDRLYRLVARHRHRLG